MDALSSAGFGERQEEFHTGLGDYESLGRGGGVGGLTGLQGSIEGEVQQWVEGYGIQALGTKESYRLCDLPISGEHDFSRGGTESLRGDKPLPVNIKFCSRGMCPGFLILWVGLYSQWKVQLPSSVTGRRSVHSSGGANVKVAEAVQAKSPKPENLRKA